MSKYTEEMLETINNVVTSAGEVTEAVIAELVESLGVSERSITAKLRSMEYTVPTKGARTPTFTDEETARFEDLADGTRTAEDIAEEMGKTARQIRGKALACKVTLAPSPKKPAPAKTFTEEQEATIESMVAEDAFIEDIAAALDKTVPQIRGKLLSMGLKAAQRESTAKARSVVYTDEVIAEVTTLVEAGETSEAIAEKLELNLRGLRSRIGRMFKANELTKLPSDVGVSKGAFNYTPETIAEMEKLSATHTSEEAAEELGIPVGSLRAKAGKLGIKFQKPEKNTDEEA